MASRHRAMKEMSLSEVQYEALRLLDIFTEACEKEGLRYYLARGSLLGAVRSGELIEWDDDIDILMPRSDYERALRELATNDQAVLFGPSTEGFPYAFSKFVSTRTHFEEPGVAQFEALGVYLDIIPLDGVPSLAPRLWIRFVSRLQSIFFQAHVSDVVSTSGRGKTVLKTPVLWLARRIPARLHKAFINRVLCFFPVDDSQHVNDYFSPLRQGVSPMPRSMIDGSSKVLLRGKEYRTFRDPVFYLEHKYGVQWRVPIQRESAQHGRAYWGA